MTIEEAIRRYRTAENTDEEGDSCYQITPLLIRGEPLSESQQLLVDTLDLAFTNNADERGLTLFRGSHSSFVEIVKAGRAYPSFVSTSRNMLEAQRFLDTHGDNSVLFRIYCPEGTPFVDVSGSASTALERQEILLPRNTQFEIANWIPEDTLAGVDMLRLRIGQPASAYFDLRVIV